MKPIIRHQVLWLLHRSDKAHRLIRLRPIGRIRVSVRPMRKFGVKPQLQVVP